MVMTAAAAAAIAGAGAAVRTADALFAAFLGAIDREDRKGDDRDDHDYDDDVFHKLTSCR